MVDRRGTARAFAVAGVIALGTTMAMPAAHAQDTEGVEDREQSESRLATTELTIDQKQTDRFIVRYKDNSETPQDRQTATNSAGDQVGVDVDEVRSRPDGTVVVSVDKVLEPAESQEFMDQMTATGNVDYIEPDTIMTAFAANDEFYNLQWPFHGPNGGRVEEAWEASPTRGDGVTVAVVDSGYAAHPDLDANVVAGYDFVSDPQAARDGNGRDNNPTDEGDWYAAYQCGNNPHAAVSSWHGTHVAGTIAAQTDNGMGVAGVAPNAKVQPLRALAACGGYTSDIADAIMWASGANIQQVPRNNTPAQVINLSLGGNGRCSRTYQSAIDTARQNGATVVVAAGNERQNAANVQPANCEGVITVGASGETGNVASYSNFGDRVDVTAPGGDFQRDRGVLSTLNSGETRQGRPNYAYYQGTSMATPFVSGVIANMLAVDPSLSPDRIERIIKDTARPMNCQYGCGAGLIDGGAAVRSVAGNAPAPVQPAPEPEPVEAPLPNDEQREIGLPVPPEESERDADDDRPRRWTPWDLLGGNPDGEEEAAPAPREAPERRWSPYDLLNGYNQTANQTESEPTARWWKPWTWL